MRRVLRRPGHQQRLHGRRQRAAFHAGRRRAPFRKQRPRRQHRARIPRIRLRVEMPHARMPRPVRVRIAPEDVGRDLARQIPFGPAVARRADGEIHRGQVARVVAIARPHDDGNEVALADGDAFERPGGDDLAALGGSGGEALARTAATQFERPDDAIAALRVRVRDTGGDPHDALDGALPPGRDPECRRGMHHDPAGLEIARDTDRFARGIGHETRRLGTAPARNEIEASDVPEFSGEMAGDDRRAAGSDAEEIEPRAQHGRFDAMLPGQPFQIDVPGSRLHLGHRRQTSGRALENGAAPQRDEIRGRRAKVAQRQIGPARGHQPRILPDHEIVGATIARVGRHQLQRDGLADAGGGNLETDFLAGSDRADGFEIALGAADLADMPDAGEFPQGLLPPADVGHDGGHIAGFGGFPAPAEIVEQGGRRTAVEQTRQSAEIFRTQVAFARDRFDRTFAGGQGIAFRDQGLQIRLQGQASALVGVPLQSLEIHAGRAPGIGVAPVKRADPAHQVVGPIATRRVRGKADAIRQEHGVRGDVLPRREVLVEERR